MAPPTADDLQSQIDALADEAEAVKAQLAQAMKAAHGGGEGLDLRGGARLRFEEFLGEIRDFVEVMDDPHSKMATLIHRQNANSEGLVAQMRECEAVCDALGKLCLAEDLLRSVEGSVGDGRYEEAARSVSQAEQLVLDVQREASAATHKENNGGGDGGAGGSGGSSSVDDARALQLIKMTIRKKRASVENCLQDVIAAAVKIRGGSITVLKVIGGFFCGRNVDRPFPLSAAFGALATLDLLDEIMADLAARIDAALLAPMLQATQMAAPRRACSGDRASLHYAPVQPPRDGGFGGVAKEGRGGSAGGRGRGSGEDEGRGEHGNGDDDGGNGGPSSGGGGGGSSVCMLLPELFDSLLVVLSFVHEEVLRGDRALTEVLGTHLVGDGRSRPSAGGGAAAAKSSAPAHSVGGCASTDGGGGSASGGLMAVLVAALRAELPSHASRLMQFGLLATPCARFERELLRMGYLGGGGDVGSGDSGGGEAAKGPLSQFMCDYMGRFAAKRRELLLVQARSIMLGDYHNSVQVMEAGAVLPAVAGDGPEDVALDTVPPRKGRLSVGGERRVFALPRCQVTCVARDVVALAYGICEEACATVAAAAAAAAAVAPAVAEEYDDEDGDGDDASVAASATSMSAAAASCGSRETSRSGGAVRVAVRRTAARAGVAAVGSGAPTLTMAAAAAAVLFRTARDAMDLFRAVVPGQHGDQIEAIPRIAALFHNDCLFLARHALTLGHQFRARLPAPLDRTATLVDMVPFFRDLAEARFLAQIRKQQAQLLEFLDGVDVVGSGSTGGSSGAATAAASAAGHDDADDGASAQVAISKIAYHLRQLTRAWQGVLAEDLFARAMGGLRDTVAAALTTPVLRCDDFYEEQTREVHVVFGQLEEAVCAMGCGGGPSAASSSSPSPLPDSAAWAKFRAVRRLMDLDLEQIGEALQRGDLRSLSAAELSGLVRAVFQESPARTAILAAAGQA